MLVLMVFAGVGLTSFFILPNAILSEIIDEDEIITGFRREGMYFGVQGFLEHFAASFSSLVLGFWMSGLYDPTHNVIFVRFLGEYLPPLPLSFSISCPEGKGTFQ